MLVVASVISAAAGGFAGRFLWALVATDPCVNDEGVLLPGPGCDPLEPGLVLAPAWPPDVEGWLNFAWTGALTGAMVFAMLRGVPRVYRQWRARRTSQ
jgi:hypothetical protein